MEQDLRPAGGRASVFQHLHRKKNPDGYTPKRLVLSRWGDFQINHTGRGWASISDLLFLEAKQGTPATLPSQKRVEPKVRGAGGEGALTSPI